MLSKFRFARQVDVKSFFGKKSASFQLGVALWISYYIHLPVFVYRPNPHVVDNVQPSKIPPVINAAEHINPPLTASSPYLHSVALPTTLADSSAASLDALQLQEVAAAHGYSLTPIGEVQRNASQKKIKKRCAKWPNCSFGDSCRYIHPAEMCMNWPRCPFTTSCFYIHPEVACKFGT